MQRIGIENVKKVFQVQRCWFLFLPRPLGWLQLRHPLRIVQRNRLFLQLAGSGLKTSTKCSKCNVDGSYPYHDHSDGSSGDMFRTTAKELAFRQLAAFLKCFRTTYFSLANLDLFHSNSTQQLLPRATVPNLPSAHGTFLHLPRCCAS